MKTPRNNQPHFSSTVSSNAISDVRISGPSVLENGRQQYVDLICSFQFEQAEYKQLDIKWYFDNEVSLY